MRNDILEVMDRAIARAKQAITNKVRDLDDKGGPQYFGGQAYDLCGHSTLVVSGNSELVEATIHAGRIRDIMDDYLEREEHQWIGWDTPLPDLKCHECGEEQLFKVENDLGREFSGDWVTDAHPNDDYLGFECAACGNHTPV